MWNSKLLNQLLTLIISYKVHVLGSHHEMYESDWSKKGYNLKKKIMYVSANTLQLCQFKILVRMVESVKLNQ